MNEYGELIVNLYLLEDVYLKDVNDKVSKFLNYIMGNSQYLSEIHKAKCVYKGYSYSTLYPIESDKIYKANDIYRIMIRSYDFNFLKEMKDAIHGATNGTFQEIGSELNVYEHKKINKVTNITPAVYTIKKNGKYTCWTKKDTESNVEKAIFNNMIKKYNYINKTNFDFRREDIIDRVEIINNIAITMNYKGIKLLGYKYNIYFKENSFAQEMANFITVTGLLEKNSSLGCGFIKAYYK